MALYIPFWLNLYLDELRVLENYIPLYIPFWLNLYGAWETRKGDCIVFTFHSA